MMNPQDQFGSCRSILKGLKDRKFSSLEVTDYFLSKINDSSEVNAVAFIDGDQVRNSAKVADERRLAGSTEPLLGLPLSIKDSIAVKDLPWRSGSFAREHVIANEDATSVRRLREAGALFLCKTTTPEYTWSVETESALHGTTLNPYDYGKTCGGSSGGEAVLHALGASPGGLGSDGLNSIRVPAHFCGTAGIRPTAGVVPETGAWPSTRNSGLLDISTLGPMSKYADDLDLLLDVIQGQDFGDPFAHNLGDISRAIEVKNLKIGFFDSHPSVPVSEDVRRAVQIAATTLNHLGAKIEEIDPWPIQNSIDLAFSLMAPDGGELARRDVASANGRHAPSFSALLEQLKSQSLTVSQYLLAVDELRVMRAAVRETLDHYDAVILPVAASTAPAHQSSLAKENIGLDISAYSYCFVIAIAGVPSVSVPIFITSVGLPVGVQVVVRPHSDRKAIEIAHQIQDSIHSYFQPQPRKI